MIYHHRKLHDSDVLVKAQQNRKEGDISKTNAVLEADDDIFALFQVQAPVVAVRSDSSVCVSDEIERYKSLRPEAISSDPLVFWKKHQYAFPLLSQLARMYLCIPSTSAASKRTFSTAGNNVTKKRTCLNPDIVSTMIFLYGSWELVEEYLVTRDNEEDEEVKEIIVVE